MIRIVVIIVCGMCIPGCDTRVQDDRQASAQSDSINETSLIILGTLQDGGSPHAGCERDCCRDLFAQPDPSRMVVCLGIVDPEHQKWFMIEATPDLPVQMRILKDRLPFASSRTPDGIIVTHAHVGHYAGLMYLGREAMGADSVPVYAMPRMRRFLETNGPWSQLVALKNISLQPLTADSAVVLTGNVSITPFTVPHRDEYSETIGLTISGPRRKVLFIPDIDKWNKWERSIIEEIAKVDHAFIDGTFFDGEELKNRDMREIPHPFVVESMQLLQGIAPSERGKVHFIHLNHTNPLLGPQSEEAQEVHGAGFGVAKFMQVIRL